LPESERQLRGVAPAQVRGAKISVGQGVGGMFAAPGATIFPFEPRYPLQPKIEATFGSSLHLQAISSQISRNG
jgi:hypothetical protein